MTTTRRPRSPRPKTWAETVNAFIDWLDSQERSRYTTGNYRADLEDFARWWEDEHAGEAPLAVAIDDEDLRAWKRRLREEPLNASGWTEERWIREDRGPFVDSGRRRRPATVNVKLATIKSFLGWCHRKGHIPAMPELPRQVASAPQAVKALDEKEQRKLLAAAKAHRNRRTYPTVYVMIETGLRLAELVALRRKDLVLKERKGELRVRAGKGDKSRTLPLDNPELRRAFAALLGPGTDPDDPVFASQRKDKATSRPLPLTGRGIQELLDRLREGLGWDELHPHMLRHTFGQNLRRAGTDWPAIAQLMGHSSIVTTMSHYGTPSERDLARAMNRHGHGDDD